MVTATMTEAPAMGLLQIMMCLPTRRFRATRTVAQCCRLHQSTVLWLARAHSNSETSVNANSSPKTPTAVRPLWTSASSFPPSRCARPMTCHRSHVLRRAVLCFRSLKALRQRVVASRIYKRYARWGGSSGASFFASPRRLVIRYSPVRRSLRARWINKTSRWQMPAPTQYRCYTDGTPTFGNSNNM